MTAVELVRSISQMSSIYRASSFLRLTTCPTHSIVLAADLYADYAIHSDFNLLLYLICVQFGQQAIRTTSVGPFDLGPWGVKRWVV